MCHAFFVLIISMCNFSIESSFKPEKHRDICFKLLIYCKYFFWEQKMSSREMKWNTHTHIYTYNSLSLAARDSFKCKSLQTFFVKPFFGNEGASSPYPELWTNLGLLSPVSFNAPYTSTTLCQIKSRWALKRQLLFWAMTCVCTCHSVVYFLSCQYEYYGGKTFHTSVFHT